MAGEEDRFERFLGGRSQDLMIIQCGSSGEAHVKDDSPCSGVGSWILRVGSVEIRHTGRGSKLGRGGGTGRSEEFVFEEHEVDMLMKGLEDLM